VTHTDTTPTGAPLLDVRNVTLTFAGVRALDHVSLAVPTGSLFSVIGPNGAGKTSLFNCLSGVYRPDAGSVWLDGADITGQAPHRIASRGIARTFQNLGLFDDMTVLDNMLVGRHHLFGARWWQDLLWSRRTREEEVHHRGKVEELIDFLDLEAYRWTPVGALPYGVRKRVELGRALSMDAKLLLLDEPAAGRNQEERQDLARYLLDIREELGITQILIEHELRFVLELADRIAVLDFGRKIAEGTPVEIAADPHVAEAYVGGVPAGDPS
jgi:branched-chain amino acid transport system ATP-binding protein